MSGRPLVSIIVRTKDRPELLKRALMSIAGQTYRPLEVVLVNDGGCDLDMEELSGILGDVALNYRRLDKNTGRSHAGNVGLENASGLYVGFLDDDDQFYPEHVETLASFLLRGSCGVAYTDSYHVFQERIADKYVTVGKEVLYSQEFDRQKLLISNYIPVLNVLFRKDLINTAGLIDEKLEAHEDWDLWLRLSQHGDFHHIKEITAEISMRTDGSTMTSSNRLAFLETARIIHKRYSPVAADEKIVMGQNMVEWSLAKEVVARGEKLENACLVDIAETLLSQKDAQLGKREAVIQEKEACLANLENVIRDKDAYTESLENVVRDKDSRLAGIQNVLNEKDACLANLENVIRDKDAYTESLENVIRDKDSRLAGLQNVLNEKDACLANLENVIRDKDSRLANLQDVIREKDTCAANLGNSIREKDAILHHIYSSHGWKTLLFYYRVRDRIFPPSSVRRKAAERLWRFSGRNITFLKRIPDASTSPLARFLVSAYSSSALIRRSFDAANALSQKVLYPVLPRLHNRLFVYSKLYLKQRCFTGSSRTEDDIQPRLYSLPAPAQGKFHPKVSVIIPNYNHARYLNRRLDSVYGQTYKNIEVILLDDSSDDESTQILEEYRLRYPDITRCIFNDKNSGSVFYQWKRGLELAQGELIWIAESDDYCSDDLLEQLVRYFSNEAVMLAFSRTVFVEGDTDRQSWSQEEYLADLTDPSFWHKPFIRSAHDLVNTMWGIKNIVPNVSSAVFRNPGGLGLLENEAWKQMRICGDWIFYLHVIRGGLVAYAPGATNYYRMHQKNTSVNTYQQDIYYLEHEAVAKELVKLYQLQAGILERQRHALEIHWRLHRQEYSENDFMKCYSPERIRNSAERRKPNLLMVAYALTSGGGETFPVRLCNLLKSGGSSVTLLNCHREPTQQGVRKMLGRDIPLLELDRWDKLSAVVEDMGIEIVHSHHAWVDVTICSLLETSPHCKVIVTTHGMYEMMSRAEINRVTPLLNRRVDKFVYLSDKNLEGFDFKVIDKDRFVKIGNAIAPVPITPVPRENLNIGKEDFVLCTVSRAIPEKGWEEGIAAVKLARKLSGREIHLVLVGEGPEYDRLRHSVKEHFIHFAGFRDNVRDFFATADLGFLPSRFRGESYPLVVIECLQAGRPVLASDIGETAKMIETASGPAGSVFALENWKLPVKRIAELIAEYATDSGLQAGHLDRVSEAVKKFDPEKMLRSYETVYQEVLGGNGEQAPRRE